MKINQKILNKSNQILIKQNSNFLFFYSKFFFQIDRSFDSRSLTNSLSTRTSVCSIDSNNCPSPSLSYNIRQTPITNDCKSRLKPPSKVTFSQQLIINEKNSSLNKKSKPNPPSRIQNTPSSSSAVSSASSSSSSCTGGRGPSSFCGIIPLLSVDRRHNGRCYSFSSSSTDTDSVISNSHKSPTIINPKYHQTTLMRASVTDLQSFYGFLFFLIVYSLIFFFFVWLLKVNLII